jgi:hypothetical protein
MSNVKMGPGVLGNQGSESVPVTPRYAPVDRLVSNASEGSSPRKVFNPFNNPAVIEDDGTDLWVMSGGSMRLFDSDHANSLYTPCVTRVSRAGAVKDVGYYSAGPRMNGDASNTFMLDMVWCAAAKRLFAATFDFRVDAANILEVSRGPIAFTPLNPVGISLPVSQMAVLGTRLFVALADGSLLEYDATGNLQNVVNNTSFGTGGFSMAVDANAERIYMVSANNSLVGYTDISDGGMTSPTTAEFDNGLRIALAGSDIIITTSDNALARVDNTLSQTGIVDISTGVELFAFIYGVAYFDGNAYVWGVDGDGLTLVVRVLLSEMAISNASYFNTPSDGATNDAATTSVLSRGVVTDPTGNKKLWVADPLLDKALISPTGRVGWVDLADSENPITEVTSAPFVRWV